MFLPLETPQAFGATRADYAGGLDQISPVADPNVTSETMRIQLAGALKQAAATTPGYNRDAVERRYLKALRVESPSEIFQGTEGQPPQKDPKLAIEEAKIQGRLAEQDKLLQSQMQQFVFTLQEEQRLNNAKILELEAKAQNEAANAQTEQAYAQVAIINAEISRMRIENEHLNARTEQLLKAAKIQSDHQIGLKGAATGEETK